MRIVLTALSLVLLVGCYASSNSGRDKTLKSYAYDAKGRLAEVTIQKPDGTVLIESYNPTSGQQVKAVMLSPDGSKVITTHPGGVRKTVHQYVGSDGKKGKKVVFYRNAGGGITKKEVFRPSGTLEYKTVYQRLAGGDPRGEVMDKVTYLYNPDGSLKKVLR